jgi:lipopolysaccharide transport system permease protein
MLWSVFSNAVTMPIQSIQANATILWKVNFPVKHWSLLLFMRSYSLRSFHWWSLLQKSWFHIPVTGYHFLFIPAVIVLILLGMCFGLCFYLFAILYKDIQLVLPAFLQIAMYATPVVYATTELSGVFRIFVEPQQVLYWWVGAIGYWIAEFDRPSFTWGIGL